MVTATATRTGSCAWCLAPFTPNTLGRPRRYCSVACRTEAGHWREDLPGWTATLERLEAAADERHLPRHARRGVPTYLRNEIRHLRAAIGSGPMEPAGDGRLRCGRPECPTIARSKSGAWSCLRCGRYAP